MGGTTGAVVPGGKPRWGGVAVAAPLPSTPFPGLPYLLRLTLRGVGTSGPAWLQVEVPMPCRVSQSQSAPVCRGSEGQMKLLRQ